MEKLLVSPMYAWSRGVFAGVAAAIGVYTAARDKKIAGFTPIFWLVLSLLSAVGVVLHFLAKILIKLESVEKELSSTA